MMKNKTNRIIFIFVICMMFLALISRLLLLKYIPKEHLSVFLYLKDFILILFAGFVFRYIIKFNETRHLSILKKLHQTNSEIIDSNERFNIVSKATSDTIWDWKIQEDTMLWNKGIQGVFGYNNEDIIPNSKWWFDRIHPEDSLKMSVKLYSFLDQKTERWQDEYRFQCADGSYKYVFDRGFLLKDNQGKAIRMIGAIQDITKQKEEEQRLKLLETVITETKDAVLITDIDITENSIPNIIFVNQAFSKMIGYESNDVIGKSPMIFKGLKSDENEFEKLSNNIKNHKDSVIETIIYKKNGEEFWVNFSMLPVTNSDGDYSHWVAILRDITEDKKAEIEKEHLINELIQKNKDLKQFSYITSHNFRAPLSNLTGLLYLLEDIPIENEELNEILNGFKKSTHLLNETINDLVKVVIIKDNNSIEKEIVSLDEVFQNVFFQLNNQIIIHKPEITTNIDKNLKITINKAYLESIILNIISNAIKYRSPNRSPEIEIKTVEEENVVHLIFKDNGVGIDLEKNRDKIFGLYQRFHNHPDSKGLGLYLVKSQVEAMGGSIEIESAVEKGTQFCITLKK